MCRTLMIAVLLGASLSLTPALAAEGAQQMMDHSAHCGMPVGEGAVQSISVEKSKVTIAHKAIAAIDWPEMTMEFAVAKPVDLSAFAQGDTVHFLLKPEKDKKYSIAMMCAIEADAGTHEACMKAMHEEAMKLSAAAGMECKMEGGAHHEHGEEG